MRPCLQKKKRKEFVQGNIKCDPSSKTLREWVMMTRTHVNYEMTLTKCSRRPQPRVGGEAAE
jgi:hypothetical protein